MDLLWFHNGTTLSILCQADRNGRAPRLFHGNQDKLHLAFSLLYSVQFFRFAHGASTTDPGIALALDELVEGLASGLD